MSGFVFALISMPRRRKNICIYQESNSRHLYIKLNRRRLYPWSLRLAHQYIKRWLILVVTKVELRKDLYFFSFRKATKKTQLRKLVFFTFEVYFAEIFSTSLPLEAIFARRRRLRRCRRRRRWRCCRRLRHRHRRRRRRQWGFVNTRVFVVFVNEKIIRLERWREIIFWWNIQIYSLQRSSSEYQKFSSDVSLFLSLSISLSLNLNNRQSF